ncbi:MAG: ComF family protein [Leptospiraceae bacterium]|nr:ComF family protein [Leptospiraceae bacterium]
MLAIKTSATFAPPSRLRQPADFRLLRTWLGRHAHLLHVTECLLCHEGTNGGAVCGKCLQGLGRARVLPAGRCERCYLRLSSGDAHCSFCDDRNVYFDRHISLYQLTPAWREILHHWKFHNGRRLYGLFRPALRRILSELKNTRIDSVCYIDSGLLSRRNRRYQPCLDPARYLASLAGIPARAGLRKMKSTRQSEEIFNRRFFAVHDKIAPNGSSGGAVQILLEDLWTTGATANEAARVLKKNGVRKVIVLSLLLREETF